MEVNTMPFKKDDRVRVIAGGCKGRTGIIVGEGESVESTIKRLKDDGTTELTKSIVRWWIVRFDDDKSISEVPEDQLQLE